MQPAIWYVRRLKTMSFSEIFSRAYSLLRDIYDRIVLPLRQKRKKLSDITVFNIDNPPFRVPESLIITNDKNLRARAEKILQGKISFFDLKDKKIGIPFDFNRDHKHNIQAPMKFSPSIDYRDFKITGDCKYVWEPNRHHQLVVLARAYRMTGEEKFARGVIDQINSWIRQCPFGVGMNWRSPLELGIRLINWVWAVDLIREAHIADEEFNSRFLNSVYRHLWEITRKYSSGSSVNNHLIGEAAGVFVATSYFPNMKHSEKWNKQSKEILEREIIAQTYSDGFTREQAFGYHIFVSQFFLFSAMVANWSGNDFSDKYYGRLRKMFGFIAKLTKAGPPPFFGDADDGYVLDLGSYPNNISELLELASRHSCGPEFVSGIPASGYYLLENDSKDISVIFDCGEQGLKPLSAHGHADSLGFVLRAFGKEVLIDTGTYDYFSYPEWRNYFRSTHAHNCLVVNGKSQTEIRGPFLWGKLPTIKVLRYEKNDETTIVAGQHDGYAPILHKRTIEFHSRLTAIYVNDEVFGCGNADIAIYFHLSEICKPELLDGNLVQIKLDGGTINLHFDDKLTLEIAAGWRSTGYHRKVPVSTIIARGRVRSGASLITKITTD